MPDTNTTNLNLVKPEVGASSDTWGSKWNANADAVDALFGTGPALLVSRGGTGAITAANARTNLGLGTIATQAANAVAITGGSIAGITDLAVADGGTGASNAAGARTNLGLGTSATFNIVPVANGGTGASNATDARANLGAAGLGANTFTGQQTFNGGISPGFWVSAQGGTEGGEISLEKAPSGSTLSGNVVIDTAGNLLRVYELGATTRGVYVDLTAQGSQSRLLTEVDPRVRAWVNFNGTGTVAIRASNNVTSITDNGVGNYTVNLTSALPDANYAVSISWQYNAQGEMPGTNSLTTSSYVIRCRNVGGSDVDTSVCTSIVVR